MIQDFIHEASRPFGQFWGTGRVGDLTYDILDSLGLLELGRGPWFAESSGPPNCWLAKRGDVRRRIAQERISTGEPGWHVHWTCPCRITLTESWFPS